MTTNSCTAPARMRRCLAANDGSALAVVVMLLAALGVLLGALAAGTNSRLANSHRHWREDAARALAEAGLERAAAQLAEAGERYAIDQHVPLGDGAISISVERGAAAGEFVISSAGELRDGSVLLHRAQLATRVRIEGHRIAAFENLNSRDAKDAVP